MIPQKECLFCDFRGCIKQNNRTSCSNPHPEVKSTQNAAYLGYWDFPNDYAYQFKMTPCPNRRDRVYE